MNAFCPISDKQINENITRVNALFTVLIIIVFSIKPNIFLALFLTVDFFIRAIDAGKYSPLGISSKNIIKLFSIKTQLINAGPKLFAARIGAFLSFLLLVSFALNMTGFTYILSGVLGFFAFMEFALGICVACIIYPYVFRLFYGKTYSGSINIKTFTGFSDKEK